MSSRSSIEDAPEQTDRTGDGAVPRVVPEAGSASDHREGGSVVRSEGPTPVVSHQLAAGSSCVVEHVEGHSQNKVAGTQVRHVQAVTRDGLL